MNRGSSSKSPSQPLSSAAKLFTEEDEINILKSLLHKNSVGISTPLHQFSQSQITHKIRRLKEKYHKLARSKSSIKTSHDRDIYEIGRQIWGKEKTRMPSPPPVERKEKAAEISGEEVINWSDFPIMMTEVSRAFPGCEEMYKQGLMGLGKDILKGLEEKWRVLAEEEAAIQARKARLFWDRLKSGNF